MQIRSKPFFDVGAAIGFLCAAKFCLQFFYSSRYGPFRDELYYLACGEHLAWGYVDQPPLVAVFAWLSRHLFHNSLPGIRFFPIAAGTLVLVLADRICERLGGGLIARSAAALGLLFAPIYLAMDSFLSMNAFEPLFWMLCAYLVILMIEQPQPKLWIAVGVVCGVGVLNKHSMLVFAFALLVGLLLTPERRVLKTRWFWIGALLAFLFFLPNLIWEARNHWPQVEVVLNAQHFKNMPISPARFLGEQVLFFHPLSFPLWFAGLGWLLASKGGRQFRFLGWTYLIVMAIFITLHGKTYYPAPAYPMLFAAGGIQLERVLAASGKPLAFSYFAVQMAGGLAVLPFGVPILPVPKLLAYSNRLDVTSMVHTERDSFAKLPQLYADMMGWPEMTQSVAAVYHGLPEAERQSCAILAGNYGEAAAIDYYGSQFGLPKAISPHNSYFAWGPRQYTGECVILFGDNAEQIKHYFGDVQRAATITRPYSMPNEDNLPIYICRKPRMPLASLWPHLRYYI